jgi:hypothetical protein
MAEIAAASEQQNGGVEQINAGLTEMNAITQQVAANAQQSSSASVELSGQAQQMRELVDTFRLSAPVAEPAPATPAASSAAPKRTMRAPARPRAVHPLPRWSSDPETVIPFDDEEEIVGF